MKQDNTKHIEHFHPLSLATQRVMDRLFKEFDNGVHKQDRREAERNEEDGDSKIAIKLRRLFLWNKKASARRIAVGEWCRVQTCTVTRQTVGKRREVATPNDARKLN